MIDESSSLFKLPASYTVAIVPHLYICMYNVNARSAGLFEIDVGLAFDPYGADLSLFLIHPK